MRLNKVVEKHRCRFTQSLPGYTGLRDRRSELASSRTAAFSLCVFFEQWADDHCLWRYVEIVMQEELAGGKINLKDGQELKLVTDYTFKASQLRSVPANSSQPLRDESEDAQLAKLD